MSKRFSILLVFLSMITLFSCGDNKETNDLNDDFADATTGKAGYSGITEVDWANNGVETLHFKSVDPDDWRDDGFLNHCMFIPNPFSYDKEDAHIKFVVDKSVSPSGILHDSNGNPIPIFLYKTQDGSESRNYLFFDGYISEKATGSYYDLNMFIVKQGNESPERLKAGIYRLFIYAYNSNLMKEMLRDTGKTNAQRESYSMVYGDILIK